MLELVGGQVHDPLQEGRGLGSPGPAEGPDRGRVGQRHGDVVGDLGDAVHALGHRAGRPHGQAAAEPGIRAGVTDDVGVHAGDVAVPVEAHLDVLDLRTAVRQRHHVLRPRLDPARRAPEPSGDAEDGQVLGGDAGLAAEPAAHVGGDDAHRLLG